MTATEFWKELERWLGENAPSALPYLPKGVEESDLDEAEETLGYAIPEEIREFLLIHDGSGDLWLHDLGAFMSLDVILESWDQEFDLWGDGENDDAAQPVGTIRAKWFARKWLPILDTWCGDYTCVDLDPPPDGKKGQLIFWAHDGGRVGL